MSPAALTISRLFAQAFEQLAELAKTSPDEAAFLGQQVAAHLRSALPSAFMLDTGPVPRFDPEPEKETKP